MAIVKMQKVRILAMNSDRARLMDLLMEQGVTQIEDVSAREIEENYASYLTKAPDDGQVASLEGEIKTVKEAIDILGRHGKAKKVLFAPRRKVSEREFYALVGNDRDPMEHVKEIIEKQQKLGGILSEKNRITGEILSLERWSELPFPADFTHTRETRLITGTLNSKLPFEQIARKIEQAEPLSFIKSVFQIKGTYYVYGIFHKNAAEAFLNALAGYNFAQTTLPKGGSISSVIERLQSDIRSLDENYKETENQIKQLADRKEELEMLHDHLSTQKAQLLAVSKLASTHSVFMLKGWVPFCFADVVLKSVLSSFDSVVIREETREDEKPPVLLQNNRFVRPFEVITEMYSLPDPRGIDPNTIMAPFFFVFFGMMVSDAGYGILMMLSIGYILWKYKPEGQAEMFLKMLFLGGLSTAVWGAVFGGWFGDVLPIISGGRFDAPRLVDPLKDPISLLGLSFALGGIHLFVGMGAKAYMMIRDGDFWGAVFDIGLWYVVLIGLPMWLLGALFLGDTVAAVGKYMAIFGAVGLVMTQGRHEKGIIKKFLTGILSLYNVTAYLGDVLSYSRLLALGLSTGVVASVVNAMGSMGGSSIFGAILFVLVFIVGHVFNMAINILGAYVHTSRLQYVEFFGKFYESGGKAFKPFKREGKYVEVVKDAS